MRATGMGINKKGEWKLGILGNKQTEWKERVQAVVG
jgi:hypothetical protein